MYVNVLFWFTIYATYVIIIVRSATAMIKLGEVYEKNN